MSKVLLIDGNSLMFRAFYATAYTGNLMQNKSGLYTNAIFGFCNMIQKLVDNSVDKVFVAFDAGKQTFRHKEFDDYKGGRKPMPDEFKVQIPYIKKYLDLMNIKHYECLDYEADDLVAAYANLLNTSDNEVFVVSGDKDLLQLAKGNIKVCLTKKGITELDEYTESNFKEKMGFESYQVPDYKGLVGDTSDNLPGIKGIGEKTAIKLLDQYKTLENIISNVNELKGKVQSCVLEHQNVGLKCKMLATLKSDFEVPYSLEEINKINPNYKELIDFFKQLDFNSFLKK
jgi:DNA polymerase-1